MLMNGNGAAVTPPLFTAGVPRPLPAEKNKKKKHISSKTWTFFLVKAPNIIQREEVKKKKKKRQDKRSGSGRKWLAAGWSKR